MAQTITTAQSSPIAPGVTPRRRRRGPQAAVLPTAPHPPSLTAGGEWPVDHARAKRDAAKALASIDWTKTDIVVWVPGTGEHEVDPRFVQAVRNAWPGGEAALAQVEYEASWNVRQSVGTGLQTLRLVLAGIAAHTGNHRVLLAGESQGAWLIGEAISDPTINAVVQRAVLMGHPAIATHHYDSGSTAAVMEINHKGDYVATPLKSGHAVSFDAWTAVRRGDFGKLGPLVATMWHNPGHVLMTIKTALGHRSSPLTGLINDDHDYGRDFDAAVRWLRDGA